MSCGAKNGRYLYFFKREKNTGIYNPQIGQAQLLDSFAGCALLQLGLYLWNHSHSNL